MEKTNAEQFPAGRHIENRIGRDKDDDVIIYDLIGHGVWKASEDFV